MGASFSPRTWIFDLDDTLYGPESHITAQIEARALGFLAAHLSDASPETVRSLFRRDRWQLVQRVLERGVRPAAYFEFVHAVDLSGLRPDRRLDLALEQLPGRKLIFTNSTAAHAERVLRRLGLGRHFGTIVAIDTATEIVAKPDPRAYARLIADHGVPAAGAAIVDDNPENLRPAQALGLTTVWLRHPARHVRTTDIDPDFVVDDLADWLWSVAATTPERSRR